MAFSDMDKVENKNSDDEIEVIRKDGKANPRRDAQLFMRKDGGMQADQRHGMNRSDKNEEEATKILYESFQNATPDLHNKPISGSTSADEQLFVQSKQDHGLPTLANSGNSKEYDSDDIEHSKSIVERLFNQDISGDSHKDIFESSHHANENHNDQNGDAMGNLASGVSKGLLMKKDGQTHSRDSSTDTQSYSKDKPKLLKGSDKINFFLNGNMDLGNPGNMNNVVEKRKLEWSSVYQPRDSLSSGRSFRDNREKSDDTGLIKEKKARVLEYEYKESDKGNRIVPSDVSDDESQMPKQPRNVSLDRNFDPLIPVKKDSSYHCPINKVFKEGRDLKNKADSLKNIGSRLESTGLYFQAALKFIQGASLLEPDSYEIAELREITDSMFMYREAAKLCELVANEYERYNEMAAAALAYKCMEVAYMRVVFSKAPHVNQDRNMLQVGLPNIFRGESPSSPGSVSFHHHHRAIVAGNQPKIQRVPNFVQDVCIAMGASKNYQKALDAAKEHWEGFKYPATFLMVQKVIGFNFHDIEEVIRLTGLALEAIDH